MAYTPVSKTGGVTPVWVQLPPPALNCMVDPKEDPALKGRKILQGSAKNK